MERSLSATAARMTTALESGTALMTPLVACVAYMALSIPRLVRVKVAERMLSTLWDRSPVTVARIVAVIDVAVEAVGPMKPWTGSNENTPAEPIRPIITIGSAAIWGIVEVAIRTHRRRSNADGNLSWCYGHAAHQCDGESRESKQLPSRHNFSWIFQFEFTSHNAERTTF
jgi:hypothetical protein